MKELSYIRKKIEELEAKKNRLITEEYEVAEEITLLRFIEDDIESIMEARKIKRDE